MSFNEKLSKLVYGIPAEDAKITIVMPTYKRYELFHQALLSAINQDTNEKYEILIVDNDPEDTDKVLNIVKECNSSKVLYYRNIRNLGMMGNFNQALILAHGEWVIMLHDDDTLPQNCISNYYSLITDAPKYNAFFCGHKLINENNEIIGDGYNKKETDALTRKEKKYFHYTLLDFYWLNSIQFHGMLIKRKTALQLGGYREELYPCSDFDFITRLLEHEDVAYTPQVLYNYRIFSNESTKHEIQANFIIQPYTIMDEMNTKLGFSNYINNWHRQQMALSMEKAIIQMFGSNTDDIEAIKKMEKEVNNSLNIHQSGKISSFLHKLIMIYYKQKMINRAL